MIGGMKLADVKVAKTPTYLSTEQAATVLGCSRENLRRYVHAGLIGKVPDMPATLYLTAEVLDLHARLRLAAAGIARNPHSLLTGTDG